MNRPRRRWLSISLSVTGLVLLFALYTRGLSKNPPGFYLDESATAYNAYLVSRTGAGEFGPRFPLMFQFYDGSAATYVNPATIYLLAIVFRFLPPGILVARMFAAFWMFAACLLLGLLAKQISGERKIGIMVGATALLTPWFVEIGRLVWDAHFVAFTVVVVLLAAYHASRKETWTWRDVTMLALSLTLLTYGYFSGRVLAPLFAIGLLSFATTRPRLLGILKTWLVYGLTLVPIFLFNRSHPDLLTKRLYEISYIRPGASWSEIVPHFLRRYLQDQSLTALLVDGDYHPRHHVQGSGEVIFFATFILAMLGLLLILTRRWRDPWWRFVLFGLAASIVPGAITIEPFHQLRLMGYAVFLLLITVPALEWLLGAKTKEAFSTAGSEQEPGSAAPTAVFMRLIRLAILSVMLALTVVEALRFHAFYRRQGPKRPYEFDVPYKTAYDLAVRQPSRPIYLEDGKWGPAYIHAYWYATIEGRPLSEFVHLPGNARPPAGAIVISADDTCQHCESIAHPGVYLVYKAR